VLVRASVIATAVCFAILGISQAGEAPAAIRRPINIPAQDLGAALRAVARERELYVIFAAQDVDGLRTAGAAGTLTPDETFQQLLAGSGLTYRFIDEQTVTILPEHARREGAGVHATDKAVAPDGKTEETSSRARFRLAQVDQGGSSANASVGQGGGANAAAGQLAEIVVTARKRAERLSDVPIAVQAATAEDLYQLGARSFADYSRTLAGVQSVEAGPGRDQIFMRGVAAPQGYIGMESAVGVYLDDVPISEGMSQPDLNLYDIDRVEVLRGPQGTLYGSASLGGTIRIITNHPDLGTPGGSIDTEVSDTKHGGINPSYSATVNLPVVMDRVGLRAVVYGRNPSGFIDDPVLGKRRVNDEDTYGGRATLRVQPTDALTVDVKAMSQHTHIGGDNSVEQIVGDSLMLDQYRNEREPFVDRSQIYNATVAYRAAAFTLDSSSSFSHRQRDVYNDFTGLNVLGNGALTPSYQRYIAKSLTQELRLSSTEVTPFSWLIGAYFNRTRDEFYQTVDSVGAGQLLGLPSDNVAQLFQDTTSRQVALFGEAGYSPIERLTLTGGFRVASLRLDSSSLREGALIGAVLQNAGSTTQHASAPKANISWKLTEDALVYVQATKGYRIGGVNATIGTLNGFVFPTSYGPDSLWNYEVGLKGAAFERRVNFDLDVFYIDWKNIQVDLQYGGFDYFANAGNAVSRGLEAQSALQVSTHVQVGGQITYTDAKLTSTRPGVGQDGDRVPFVPRFASSVFVELGRNMDGGRGYLRVDGQYVGTAYTGFGATGNFRYGGYALTNLKLAMDRQGWRFGVFVKNAFDRRATLFAQPYLAGVVDSSESVTVTRPRTVGAEASWQF
jgi:outer membrane receptor protein involved in Fe transport